MATRPVLHTAVAKTKNKASDYNENFSLMMQYCEDCATESKNYVDGFMPSISTNTKGKFLTNNGSTASWQGLGSGFPFSNMISGLIISKSTDDTVSVSAGSCYDSTGAVVLALSSATTKQNSSQAASTTYYVYIIGDGTNVDLLIDDDTPSLPSGYIYYRLLGTYTTDENSKIKTIRSLSNDNEANLLNIAPDYSRAVSFSPTNGGAVGFDGYIAISMTAGSPESNPWAAINGIKFTENRSGNASAAGYLCSGIAMVRSTDILSWGAYVSVAYKIPFVGGSL